jgi:hypothetical protein
MMWGSTGNAVGRARIAGRAGVGLGETKDQRLRISDRDADRLGIGGAARVEILGAGDGEKNVGVLRAQLRRQDPTEREREVLGGERSAIGPPQVAAQMERPRQAVRRRFPALRGGADRLGSGLVDGGQALEKCEHDGHVVECDEDLRIEIARFGADGEVQGAGAPALLDPRFATPAAGEAEDEGESEQDGCDQRLVADGRGAAGG